MRNYFIDYRSMIENLARWILASVVIAGCAKAGSPTGGPVDEDPPQPILMAPENFGLFYSASGFTIWFDEYIKSEDLGNQLIVSPPLAKKPEFKVRGRKLILSWEEPLKANTTYQFNFGKGIADINEGNANTDLLYVCSTGSYIDSMRVQGKIYQALNNQPLGGASVMLYYSMADSLPLTTKPDYFSMSREDGTFDIRFLPPDTFKLFVLVEKNNNYLYDGPPEEIGFLTVPVYSAYGDSLQPFVVSSFVEADTVQYIASSTGKDFGLYTVVFNVPAGDVVISFVEVDRNEVLESIDLLNATGDTLRSWVTLPDYDAEEINVVVRDGSRFRDTLVWYIETDPKYKDKSKLEATSNLSRSKLDIGKVLELRFSNPLVLADTTLMQLFEDSLQVPVPYYTQTDSFRKMQVNFNPARNKNYLFVARAGAFKDIFGNFSDSIGFAFGLQEIDHYGTLKVRLLLDHRPEQGQKLIQLTDGKGGVLTEKVIEKTETLDFGRLNPGKYGLKIIFDENANGIWDSGRYKNGRQPEKLSIYEESIDIRSNWDLELEWKPVTPFD